MVQRRISVCVGGLWRTDVVLEGEAIWRDLKKQIEKATSIPTYSQNLTPYGRWDERCELEEGDDVFCDWRKLFDGCHPLHDATYDRNINAIRSWIASCADINVTNMFGETSLMLAAAHLIDESVIELLCLGANTKLVDKNGDTALHCITNGQYYFDEDFDEDKMEKIVKMLIKAGCDPMVRNNDNETFVDVVKRIHGGELAMEVETWIKEAIGEA